MNEIVDLVIKPGVQFFEKVKRTDKVAVVHGHDNDSICSAAIVYKLLEKMCKIEPKLIISGMNSSVTEDVLDAVKKFKPNHVVIVDLAEIPVNILTELRNISQVLIIDHHVPKGYVKVTYVNPRIFDKQSYLPATYLCYKIYADFLDVKEILWIAGIGTLSDMGLKNCNDLFDNIKSANKELVENNENIDEFLFENSLLGKLAKVFDSARVVNGIDGAVAALNVLIKYENYQDVLKGKSSDARKLLEYYTVAEKEFNRLLKDFDKKKEKSGKFVIYEVRSKYNMKSPLAGYLAKTLTNEVLVIYQKIGKYINVSFRRGKVSIADLNQLAANLVKNIPDSNGGGHIQASGATLPATHLNRFLRNLKSVKP